MNIWNEELVITGWFYVKDCLFDNFSGDRLFLATLASTRPKAKIGLLQPPLCLCLRETELAFLHFSSFLKSTGCFLAERS